MIEEGMQGQLWVENNEDGAMFFISV